MGRKRGRNEVDAQPSHTRREDSKRAKTSPSDETQSNSSAPSSCSVSEDSALQSSPSASYHTRQSSISSLRSNNHDELDLSSSSEEGVDTDPEDTIINVGAPEKPSIQPDVLLGGAQDLQARIATLLPQLVAANGRLASNEHGQSMEDVEDGEPHIEMNLGLGVLEEMYSEGPTGPSDETSDSGGEYAHEKLDDTSIPSGASQRSESDQQADFMANLLGQRRGCQRSGIEEVG